MVDYQGNSRGRGRGRGQGRGQSRGRGNYGRNAQETSRHSDNRFSSRDNQGELNATLPERFRHGRARRGNFENNHNNSDTARRPDIKLNPAIREYIQQQNAVGTDDSSEDWLRVPEIPTSEEIWLSEGTEVRLQPNRTKSAYKSTSRYLKTHYKLLREDAASPLRDAIDAFRKNPDQDDNNDMSIYSKVHIAGFTFTQNGIAARVKFSTIRAGRKILWSASKRLVSGSIVALTPADDNFAKKCIVAIVAARPLSLLEESPPQVDLYFSRPDELEIDPQVEYVMVEARTGYFEAYRHTLRALQKLSSESFPLSNHITALSTDIQPPQYLLDDSIRDLSASLEIPTQPAEANRASTSRSESWRIDILRDWPQEIETTMDSSQWNALQQMLTKELAIVQGPPGTGKTYVSRIALEIMVKNRAEGDPPIIIAAQTNHALDQLLTHVSQFDPNYIRLGGRSTDSEVKKRALYEVRQKEVIGHIPGSNLRKDRNSLDTQQVILKSILSAIHDNGEPISSDKLLEDKIISPKQKKSLEDALQTWVTSDAARHSPIQHWLGRELVPFELTYSDDNFGFENIEEDLEMEQLRETEAEHGVDDEEDIEMLRGPYIPISDNWVVPGMLTEDELSKAGNLLDTREDLWSIPERLRGPVYKVMQMRAKSLALTKFREVAGVYDGHVQNIKIGKWEKDAVYLERANVIGLTTTGLSKYRPLISSLKPKIILIEEAAEVIEGPIAVACMNSLQHLILVGDHQQLQGHCSVRELAGDPYYLNISMFERLVKLDMPFKRLNRQRRMNPLFRRLISTLYGDLDDHPDVVNRVAPAWGTGKNRSFFFDHEFFESKDESMSTLNEQEASMVVKFYRHLRRHGVPPSAVTILTFYNGQRKRILQELRKDPETNDAYNKVKTVDSYQGEENDIVILSLVRSNTEGSVGFVNDVNRVCVALSRAKLGFYLFGNARLLASQSELWLNVCQQMSRDQPSSIGTSLPIECTRHGRVSYVRYPEDFDDNQGGCNLRCDKTLPCGHACVLKCHPYAESTVVCPYDCERVLNCGHPCTRKCYERCVCVQQCGGGLRASDHDVLGYDGEQEYNHSHDFDLNNYHSRREPHRTIQPAITPSSVYSNPSHPISEQHNQSANEWGDFAASGVKQHDQRLMRESMAQMELVQKNTASFASLLDDDESVVQETIQPMSNGRSKFSQTFQPARKTESVREPQSGSDGWSTGTPMTKKVINWDD